MNNTLFKIFFFCVLFFFNLETVNAQRRRNNNVQRDTIWVMDGKYYTYDPLKKALPVLPTELVVSDFKSTKKSDYRSLVDSLSQLPSFTLNEDSLVAEILLRDSVFNSSWCTSCVFEANDNKLMRDTVLVELIKGSEKYLYNQWGSFGWGYGPRWGRMHRGLDIGLITGDTIRSSFNGIVRYAEFNTGGFGNCVVVRHFNGIETLYAHMSEILVKPGELVFTADVLGLGGSTGRSDGPHLHFETRYKGQSFDPLKIFNKDTYTIHKEFLVLQKKDIQDPTPPVATRKYHTVKQGETLSQIARKYRTSVANLQRLNGLKNANKISVGKRLIVK